MRVVVQKPKIVSLPQPRLLSHASLAKCFLVGALMVTLLDDIFHVRGGVLHYPERNVLKTLLLFGSVGILAGAAVPRLDNLFSVRPEAARATVVLREFALLTLMYALSAAIPGRYSKPFSLWLTSMAVARAYTNHQNSDPAVILHTVGFGIGGALGEHLISSTGHFYYRHRALALPGLSGSGVPAWLPPFWANASHFIVNFVRFLPKG